MPSLFSLFPLFAVRHSWVRCCVVLLCGAGAGVGAGWWCGSVREMAKVLVFHFTEEGRLPKLSDEERKEIMNRFYEVLKEYPDVRFNGTYVDENGMGICDWEAPNAEVVREIVEKALGKPPVDPVIVVKRVL